MAARFTFIKLVSGLFAAYGSDSQELAAKVKPGQLLTGEFKKDRGYENHKRYFALLGILFDYWSETMPPQEYKGRPVLPDFERFRHDVAIMAGFYRPVWNLNGELRLEAESISFASMAEDRFQALFSATINVGLGKILDGKMDEATLRNRVDELLSFDK